MACVQKSDRIFVAGHKGLVGSALVKTLKQRGYENLILRSRKELDLENSQAVRAFYEKEKPNVVFVAAAKVGGIYANNTYRADFISQNLSIQNNVIWGAHLASVHRLIFLGSSCIYPREAPQPMPETCLLTGPLEYTNRPYAIAKIAGLELVQSIRKQYGRDYFSVMPTNLYGPQDRFDPEESHVIPALIQRFHHASVSGEKTVKVWGSGKPLREFMFSLDCADAIVFLAEKLSKEALDNSAIGKAGWSHMNVGSGQEVSIKHLAKLIAQVTKYKGQIEFDSSKPDGVKQKLLDSGFLHSLGWKPHSSLEQGLEETCSWYEKSVEQAPA